MHHTIQLSRPNVFKYLISTADCYAFRFGSALGNFKQEEQLVILQQGPGRQTCYELGGACVTSWIKFQCWYWHYQIDKNIFSFYRFHKELWELLLSTNPIPKTKMQSSYNEKSIVSRPLVVKVTSSHSANTYDWSTGVCVCVCVICIT